MEICRTDRIGLAAQDWLVPAPAKIVVTSADGESKEGREEGRRTSEHLQEEEVRLPMKNEERRDRPIVTDHTHLPDHLPYQLPDHPRSSLGRPYRTQGLPGQSLDTRPQNRFTTILPSDRQTAHMHPRATRSFTQPSRSHIVREHQPDSPYKTQRLRGQLSRTRAQDLGTSMLTRCFQPDHPYVQPPDQRPHAPTKLPVQSYTKHQTSPEATRSLRHALTDQTNYQMCTYQPEYSPAPVSLSQINYQMCTYQPEYSPAPVSLSQTNYQIIVCNPDHLITWTSQIDHQQDHKCCENQHGHYTDIEPNSFRSGDDWPD
jgi:hypothetical protein